ncbi:uncharacterized protein PSANT_00959 [Moesziomyces antarcticus]|uniref:Secreted protein n=1 Tax=Pseudozyma antarctica TaxID=84753 RepID=A0A5C3FHT4_PSEA2|nr:uncharacterized protein PSANT_00959 [Moesziomyces antarcticus]
MCTAVRALNLALLFASLLSLLPPLPWSSIRVPPALFSPLKVLGSAAPDQPVLSGRPPNAIRYAGGAVTM